MPFILIIASLTVCNDYIIIMFRCKPLLQFMLGGVSAMDKPYEKPELIEYDNLNEITGGDAGS